MVHHLPAVVTYEPGFGRISHTFVGRNEQTPTLPELRSLRYGQLRQHSVNRENRVCAVPARLCDLVPAYCEKCGLILAILAVASSLSMADEFLVQTGKGTNWQYSSNKSAADWNQTDYDASQWPEGRAPLGYGRKDLTTVFEKGDTERLTTIYLRTKFEVVESAEHIVMYVRADDGFVAYLNGREVTRWNVAEGDVDDDTNAAIAINGINESFMMRFVLPVDGLVQGQNLLAVEVHQAAGSEDDMVWDAGLASVAGFDPLHPVLKTEARQASEAYHQQHYVGPQMSVPDGYLDGGRGMRVDKDGQAASGREIVHVDRSRDTELQKHLAYARSDELKQLNFTDRATRIARYVYQAMSPPDGNRTSVMRSSYLAQLYSSQEVLLGDVTRLCGAGVCRHRTLLFKIMADEAGLKTAIVRGNYWSGWFRIGGHAWNELFLEDGSKVIVDVMNPQPDFYFPSVNEPSVRGYLTVKNERWYPAEKATESKE